MNNDTYLPTIGLEVHAELKTETKMFCASKNAPHEASPNIHICPICMGHPGTLPAINKKAVESVIKVGIALGGTIANYTEFDRKNYFYPDIPKGYQISQFSFPLVTGGELNGVTITRVHLEEDTARSTHRGAEGTIIDYNRAGVPLMELVTEPVIHDAKTAGDFGRELQLLLRSLKVSDANMEEGQMRVEVNVSVGKDGNLGTKVEVKNLNSFKSVEGAVAFEVKRQIALIEEGGAVVQETRGWDEVGQKTFSQRKKESSHDYRYFPDPDLPKIDLSVGDAFNISRLSEIMPELPSKKRIKYQNLGLTKQQSDALVADMELGFFFEDVSKALSGDEQIKVAGNYITSDLVGITAEDPSLSIASASSRSFASLIELIVSGVITSRVAKDLLKEVVFSGLDPEKLVVERGLAKSASQDLGAIVEAILRDNPAVVEDFKNGKETVIQYFVGQGMRQTKGASDPDELRTLFLARLKE